MKSPSEVFNRSEINAVLYGRLLVPRLMSALMGAHDRALAKFGLTSRQGALLLNCALGEGTTPAELARFQDLDISTITRMVERLRKKGWLRRTRDRNDRRRVILSITPEGYALIREALPISLRIAKDTWKGVTAAEKRALVSITEKVLKNLGHDLGPFPKRRTE